MTMDAGSHTGVRALVREASKRKMTDKRTGKITSIREDFENKKLARIEVEFSGSSSEIPKASDTVTISKKLSADLSLGDRVTVSTTITKVS